MKGNISTKTGDDGLTGLIGGHRVDKDDPRVECLGELDAANSAIGLLRAKLAGAHDWEEGLQRIQTELMNLMSHVATPGTETNRPKTPLPRDSDRWMEMWMEDIETSLATRTEFFLLPGGNEISALCHVSRTQVRKAERRLIRLNRIDPVDSSILRFANRLSDLLFKLARQEMARSGVEEIRWRPFESEEKRTE